MAFSGGKDSIVTEKLVVMSGVRHDLWYSCTRIDPPEVVRFIKKHYPHCNFAFPKITFWQGILAKNPPTFYTRWCCDHLKKRPTLRIGSAKRIMGIRKEESNKRRKYPRINKFKGRQGQIQHYPILDWTEADVWEFIEGQGLTYPALYDEGFDRLGCVVCPFRGPKQHAIWRSRWPGIYHTFEVVVTKWWYLRQAQGRDMRHDSPEEYLQAWYRKDFKAFGKDPTPEELEEELEAKQREWAEEDLLYEREEL